MSAAVSPDGRYLLVLNGGYRPPTISVLDVGTSKEIGRSPVPDAWLGLAFSADGKRLYAGGGAQAAVFEFAFENGALRPSRRFNITEAAARTHRDFVGDVALSPDGRLVYAAALFHDAIHVINPQSGRVIERFATGRRPYRILFHPDGRSFFVSSWADGTVTHHDAVTGERLAVVRVGPHATDMLWRAGYAPDPEQESVARWQARIFVTASNSNLVHAIGVSEAKDLQRLESINVAMTPRQPAGMTPSALALSPDATRLYVACSDANAVAVVDVTEARSNVLGFVPTGWYPTAVQTLPDGRLVILNGRGERSYPNPAGPNPYKDPAPVHAGLQTSEYTPRLQTGTASFVPPFDDEQLDTYSRVVLANSPYSDALLDRAPIPEGNPVPARPGDPSPIRHVIYVVKENRTYDQILGGLGKGNGDPGLVLFGENVTPNHHKLARDFVLFDNFYVNADVSADGHNWSTSAIANDYVQKLWPNSYGKRRVHYDYEGGEPAALPPAGYLWTNAHQAGITMRNYGWWATKTAVAAASGAQITGVRDPVLARVTNPDFRPFDMDYPDVERVRVFQRDLDMWEKSGTMPRLLFVRLGNDHTWGTQPGKLTPNALVADNDYALGLLVEAVSRSRFWPQTAIFVLEDDAQNGPDHVDSHRAPAFIISPYTRRAAVDSNMYNTVSMLRTMELILGLRPMTHFDAAARPMHAAFSGTADARPWTAEKPRVQLDERNPAENPTAARTARLDFSEADRIDDFEMNAILWRALRGTEPPSPLRSWFGR